MSLPIISVPQMRAWERATWAAGQTEQGVIARVGEALARVALDCSSSGDSILLLAGKGHNGDDVRAMVPHLKDRKPRLIEVREAATALAELRNALGSGPSLVVDGLFGIGLSRPLDQSWVDLIGELNAANLNVLAVDVPSGLGADTGQPMPVAVRARVTATVGAPKRGFFAATAAEFVGRLEVLSDVGLIKCPVESELQWTIEEDFPDFPPTRGAASHKGTFGHVALVAGSLGYHGASVLAARGAQRARPGLVTVFAQPETYGPVASQSQAAMVHLWPGEFDLSAYTAVLFGPGLAAANLVPTVRRSFEKCWRNAPVPVIADASALDWLPSGGKIVAACRVMTPHPGEAARILNCPPAEVQRDRVRAVRELSRRGGDCWVVLKGQNTLIGRANGPVFVNGTGNPGLAQGGSGDLLAGFIAGLLAQPLLQPNPLLALRYAVREHGAAADRLAMKRRNWIVEDLATELGG